MNFKIQNSKTKKFDLEERTAKFGEEIIKLVKETSKNTTTIPILDQLIRSGTSIGANYCEADGAESGRDFWHKIAIVKKEAKETKHWLRMLAIAVPKSKEKIRKLWQEAQELTLIFSSILRNRTKK